MDLLYLAIVVLLAIVSFAIVAGCARLGGGR
ncbi:MAG: potassium ABC transporter ATPase [Gammaproteobacteria bacterium]